jgi:hypothetical protein
MHFGAGTDCVPTWWCTLSYGLSAMAAEAKRSETSFVEIAKFRNMVFTDLQVHRYIVHWAGRRAMRCAAGLPGALPEMGELRTRGDTAGRAESHP